MTDRLAEIRAWHKGGVWRSGDIPYLLNRLETVENRVIELEKQMSAANRKTVMRRSGAGT